MIEERSSQQSGVPAVQRPSARKSAETITMFHDDVAEQELQDFLCYNPRRKDRSYAKEQLRRLIGYMAGWRL